MCEADGGGIAEISSLNAVIGIVPDDGRQLGAEGLVEDGAEAVDPWGGGLEVRDRLLDVLDGNRGFHSNESVGMVWEFGKTKEFFCAVGVDGLLVVHFGGVVVEDVAHLDRVCGELAVLSEHGVDGNGCFSVKFDFVGQFSVGSALVGVKGGILLGDEGLVVADQLVEENKFVLFCEIFSDVLEVSVQIGGGSVVLSFLLQKCAQVIFVAF